MAAWKQMGMAISEAGIRLRAAEGDPELEAASEVRLRKALLAMRAEVDAELAALDRPAAPVPEKVAGHIPEPWRSQA